MGTVFMGGRQAGCIGLLTLLAMKQPVQLVVCNGTESTMLRRLAGHLGLAIEDTIHTPAVVRILSQDGLLISVHGGEIVPQELLDPAYWGGINIHPFPFSGRQPIAKLLKAGSETVFLRAHRMTDKLDSGDVLAEEIVDVSGLKTCDEIYNKLYPYYSLVLIRALEANQSYKLETEMSQAFWDKYREEILEEFRSGK